jgi:hypothetical protein
MFTKTRFLARVYANLLAGAKWVNLRHHVRHFPRWERKMLYTRQLLEAALLISNQGEAREGREKARIRANWLKMCRKRVEGWGRREFTQDARDFEPVTM